MGASESSCPNIGNAKLEGLLTQLNLTGQRYNTALVRPFKLSGFIYLCELITFIGHVLSSMAL